MEEYLFAGFLAISEIFWHVTGSPLEGRMLAEVASDEGE